MTTLYEACVAAGLTLDSHESDLYVLDTPEARQVYYAHASASERRNASRFRSEDGQQWIDIPFSYDPFWSAAQRQAEKQMSRETDARRLASGEVTREALWRENTFLPAERTRVDFARIPRLPGNEEDE